MEAHEALPTDESPINAVEDSITAIHGKEYAAIVMSSTISLEVARGLFKLAAIEDREQRMTMAFQLSHILIANSGRLCRDFCGFLGKDVKNIVNDINAFANAGVSEYSEIMKRKGTNGPTNG
jgi:hypothetical protein